MTPKHNLAPKFRFARALVLAWVIFGACRSAPPPDLKAERFPPLMLWAWERPENLEFLDAERFGVAFLAQTLRLERGAIVFVPRHQPLIVAPDAKLIAVTRIETARDAAANPLVFERHAAEITRYIKQTLDLKNVSGVQVDFDAKVSERAFYRALLENLRRELPADVPLSITALASFCIGDDWLRDLPVDEVVPMVFRMGADERAIKKFLADGNDFRVPLCRMSYGTALDEPIKTSFASERRVYFFNVKPWSKQDIESLDHRIKKFGE